MVCEFDTHPHDGPCIPWAGKPALTSANSTLSNPRSGKMEGGPGAASTAPDLADPSREGASNGER